jgi:hypothetical protein
VTYDEGQLLTFIIDFSMLSNQKIDPKEDVSKQLKKVQDETHCILEEDAISKPLKH